MWQGSFQSHFDAGFEAPRRLRQLSWLFWTEKRFVGASFHSVFGLRER